jgi:hypothetical protein
MTKKRAEQLTGYEVRQLHDRDRRGRVAYGAFEGDELIAEGTHLSDDLAFEVFGARGVPDSLTRSAQAQRRALRQVS